MYYHGFGQKIFKHFGDIEEKVIFPVQLGDKKKKKNTFQLFEAKVNDMSVLSEILNIVKIECDYQTDLGFISLICLQQDCQHPI